MKLTIPEGPFSAYLFDCDGTIADTMPLHFRAWSQALAEVGCPFSEDIFYGWAGMPVVKTIELLNEQHGLSMLPSAVSERREELFFEHLHEVQPILSVVEHVHAKHGEIPLAVVSGSPHASVVKTLTAIGLLDRFDAIIGAEDAPRGKPHPDPFLTAARKLKVQPEKCLVFEDAEFGIQAAQAAGMKWVRVPRTVTRLF